MRFDFYNMPTPLLHIIALFLAADTTVSATPAGSSAGLSFGSLFGRGQCAVPCGWAGQLCCAAGEACYTDSSNQAQCSSTAWAAATTTAYVAGNGYWTQYTTTYVETDLVTVTSVMSSYIAGQATTAWVAATTSVGCNYAINETPCGNICCASDQYCYTSGQCAAAANGGSSGYYSSYTTGTAGYSAPLRPTSSTLVVVTATSSPTTTVPFLAPVATGANITLTPTEESTTSHGLSGGAIAGIVIGVLLGLALLFLICFYCCLKGIFDGILAIFGLGGRKRRETEYIEERHHHSSYGGGSGRRQNRTWYGASRPNRPERRDKKSGSNLLGIGAALAAVWAVLGLKRSNDRRREEKSEYSGTSYGSYYTSESSASSDDRRTRDTRRSSRR